MADVEDLRSASEEEEESEDEYAYESEASTDPVADAGDPCQANLLPCRAFKAAKRACRAGGWLNIINWRQVASGAMRSSKRIFGGKATK